MEREKNQFIQHKYAGSGWLKKNLRHLYSKDVEIPPFNALVADILGYVWRGLYHQNEAVFFKKAIWIQDKPYLEIVIFHEIATFDGSEMSELVILCHQYHVRLAVSAVTVKREYEGMCYETAGLKLMFHPRQPTGSFWQRHPSLSQVCDRISKDIEIGILQPLD